MKSPIKKRPGFTLIELLVVMSISMLLGGIVTDFYVQMNVKNQRVQAASLAQRDLSLATDKFNRILRSATIIISASETSLTVRGYPNPSDEVPSQISIFINGSKVSYSVIAPTGTAPNYTYNQANAKTYTLLPNVTNSIALPLFKCYNNTNTLLPFPVTIASVTEVEFLPSAKDADNILSTPIAVSTRVQLRNFKTNL